MSYQLLIVVKDSSQSFLEHSREKKRWIHKIVVKHHNVLKIESMHYELK